MAAAPVAAPSDTVKASLRSLRCSARQGSRFMRGMSVETPQGEPAGGEEGSGIALHGLRLGAGRQFHLAERIALLRGNAHAARDHIRHARDVRATAADE